MDNNEELEIQHRNLIEEEEIVISELPIEIKKQMRDFNEKLKEYEETEDEDLFFELQQDDVLIADNIVTYLEDLEGDDEEEVVEILKKGIKQKIKFQYSFVKIDKTKVPTYIL